MNESAMLAFIRSVIRQELASIMLGTIVSNESEQRMTVQSGGVGGPIANTRSIQPFGVSSRAPVNTAALLVPIAGDATHIVSAGHFDTMKPTVEDGEVALYNNFGQLIYVSNGKIQVGSKSSAEPLVLGNVFKSFMDQFLTSYLAHTHEGNLGYPTGVPINASDVEQLKSSPLDDDTILSGVAFTEKGGS